MTIEEAISWYETKLGVNETMGFKGPQNEAARLSIAALREQLTGKNKEIERIGLLEMECDNTHLELSNLRLEYESCQVLLKNAQADLACATAERDAAIAERDAAIKDVHKAATGRYCEICDHDCIGRYFEFAACSDFKYCGLQREE